jgi:tetratricopeptide (TPR) repeat protein
MSTHNKNVNNEVSVCANCGKGEEESGNLKSCTACKMVKYCNRECQIAHRSQHKKECRRRAAELHDEELFKHPPPDDCPICFLRLPTLGSGSTYMSCCGKVICSGCSYAPVYDDQGNKVDHQKCPFCRTPAPKTKKMVAQYKIREQAGDPIAMFKIGIFCRYGRNGFPQDYTKTLELWHRSAELGYAKAYASIGFAYENGRGVERDEKKATHYYELAAMKGDEDARYNLGQTEMRLGNMTRAAKHFMNAVDCGDGGSLNEIKHLYSIGHVTKEDYTTALRSYQEYLGEIKSIQRDEAAAFSDELRYY